MIRFIQDADRWMRSEQLGEKGRARSPAAYDKDGREDLPCRSQWHPCENSCAGSAHRVTLCPGNRFQESWHQCPFQGTST